MQFAAIVPKPDLLPTLTAASQGSSWGGTRAPAPKAGESLQNWQGTEWGLQAPGKSLLALAAWNEDHNRSTWSRRSTVPGKSGTGRLQAPGELQWRPLYLEARVYLGQRGCLLVRIGRAGGAALSAPLLQGSQGLTAHKARPQIREAWAQSRILPATARVRRLHSTQPCFHNNLSVLWLVLLKAFHSPSNFILFLPF